MLIIAGTSGAIMGEFDLIRVIVAPTYHGRLETSLYGTPRGGRVVVRKTREVDEDGVPTFKMDVEVLVASVDMKGRGGIA